MIRNVVSVAVARPGAVVSKVSFDSVNNLYQEKKRLERYLELIRDSLEKKKS